MKQLLIIFLLMFGILEKASANYSKLVYEFEFNGIDGNKIKLSNWKIDRFIFQVFGNITLCRLGLGLFGEKEQKTRSPVPESNFTRLTTPWQGGSTQHYILLKVSWCCNTFSTCKRTTFMFTKRPWKSFLSKSAIFKKKSRLQGVA